jgi:predicted GNAT family N-acyltransferase
MLHDLEKLLEKQGVIVFSLHARQTAIGFYEKSGYVVTGGEFIEVGITHVKMQKIL